MKRKKQGHVSEFTMVPVIIGDQAKNKQAARKRRRMDFKAALKKERIETYRKKEEYEKTYFGEIVFDEQLGATIVLYQKVNGVDAGEYAIRQYYRRKKFWVRKNNTAYPIREEDLQNRLLQIFNNPNHYRIETKEF